MQPEISLAAFLFFLIFFVLSKIWFMSKAFHFLCQFLCFLHPHPPFLDHLYCLGQSAVSSRPGQQHKNMAVFISIRNPYRHTVSAVINMMKSDNDFYLRFSCSLPQIRSCTGFRMTGTFPLAGRAGCTFKPGITLGRLFTFQGAWKFLTPSPFISDLPLYTKRN